MPERSAAGNARKPATLCLHYLVCIKYNQSAIGGLIDGECYRRALDRLSFRYTRSGEPLKMTDKEMQQLMAIITEYDAHPQKY